MSQPPRPTPPVPSWPVPAPPVPSPPGVEGGQDLADTLRHLASVPTEDLDAILEAAEQAHQRLRDRLGHAGGR